MNPIIPGNKSDRTGSSGIIRKAISQINLRYAALQRDVLAIFSRIQYLRLNEVDFGRVSYMLTPDQMRIVDREIELALSKWIADGNSPAEFHWYAQYDEAAHFLGTTQTAANLGRASEAYAIARQLSNIVRTDPYRTRLAMAQFRSYEHWVSLSSQAKSDITSIITRAVSDGKNPKAVRTEIAERIEVSRSRAALYAQTDITGTLREARVAEAEQAEIDLGIKTGLLWTSALKTTTRPWHASRHGNAYSRAEVKAFYSEHGNSFNCYCSITETLIDKDGNPILSDKLKKAMALEKKAWKATHVGR